MTSDEEIRCGSCGQRWDGRDLEWNGVFKDGFRVDARCPDCQSPEDSAEAEINAATTIYGRDSLGRLTVRPAL